MLDDDGGGSGKLLHQGQGRVGIEHVVVGEFLAPALHCGAHAPVGGIGGAVEGALLMGVFPVAERLGQGECGTEDRREVLLGLSREIGRDRRIVGGGHPEGLGGKLLTKLPGDGTLRLDEGEDALIVGRVHQNDDILEVLRRGPDHGGASDVDLFAGLVEGRLGLGHRLLEGVEVDADEVDGRDPVGLHLRLMAGILFLSEDAPVDLGVEGLHPSAEDLREVRDAGDVGDRDPGRSKGRGRSPGGEDFNAGGGEALCKAVDAGFVGDADQCTSDFLRGLSHEFSLKREGDVESCPLGRTGLLCVLSVR